MRKKNIVDDMLNQHKKSKSKNTEAIEENNGYTWNDDTFIRFDITTYTIQKYIDSVCTDKIIVSSKRFFDFEYDFEKKKNILYTGSMSFVISGKVYHYDVNQEELFNRIRASNKKDLDIFVENINKVIKENNPLRGKLINLFYKRGDIYYSIKKIPDVNFDNLILEKELKDDIYDNTIFHIKNINGANGIIFHGKPGLGKTYACSAIANAASTEGFTVCYASTELNYSSLSTFVKDYLSPCIIIFEDIDSIAEDRDEWRSGSSNIADFLQFVNGISDFEENIIFVATTNYLKKLDDAVKNRPMRFNRKFEFKYPQDEEINKLIDLYFNDCNISEEQKISCYKNNFAGSHIKEIRRTSDLLSLKESREIKDVFDRAVKLVKDNFAPEIKDEDLKGYTL